MRNIQENLTMSIYYDYGFQKADHFRYIQLVSIVHYRYTQFPKSLHDYH